MIITVWLIQISPYRSDITFQAREIRGDKTTDALIGIFDAIIEHIFSHRNQSVGHNIYMTREIWPSSLNLYHTVA